jgi:HK97 family phage major capsid protein
MQFTLDDVKKTIKEAAGEAVAEAWEAERAKGLERKNTNGLMVRGDRVYPKFRTDKLSEKSIDEMTVNERSIMAGRSIRFLCNANHDVYRAIDMAKEAGEKTLVEAWEKALGESTIAGGGALIAPEFSSAVIEELGAKAVVRASGVTTMPMATGSLTLPFIDSSASAAYVGENSNITKTEPTFGQLQLNNKKLAAVVPLSNDLLRDTSGRADPIIRNHLVRVMRRKEDVTFIRSPGTANEPKGMLFWAASANKFDANATVNIANVTDDLGSMVEKLEGGDVDLDVSPGWLFNARTKKYLMTARDSNGNLVWEPEMKGGTLMGYPFRMTTQIPSTLGSGDKSEVYFAAFDMLVIAENESLMIEAFAGGAYHDGSNVVSGISQDQTVIRAIALHDFGAQQRGAEISVLEEVKWGL